MNADKQERLKEGEKGAWVSIGAYLFLSALKLGVGSYAGSKALTADGLNNATDIVASVAVLVGLRIARKPADEDHRYGHYRAETVATFVAAVIMVLVGLDVLWDAGRSMANREYAAPDVLSMWTALFAAGFMMLVYRYNVRLAKRTNSKALLAAAADNRSDALVSVGAFVGIVGSRFGLSWLDPVAALAVGLIILKTAWGIFYEAAHALTDGYEEKELKQIEAEVAKEPGVRRLIDLKARTLGSNVYVDLVIGVDKDLTVEASHEITNHIEQRLLARDEIERVHIHVEPEA